MRKKVAFRGKESVKEEKMEKAKKKKSPAVYAKLEKKEGVHGRNRG